MGPALIDEGVALVRASRDPVRPYQLQAAIAAVHDEAPSAAETDWLQVLALYGLLEQVSPGPIVTLNRAVALGHGRRAGRRARRPRRLERGQRLARHHRLHAVRAHLLEMAGETEKARESYLLASRLTTSIPEQTTSDERPKPCERHRCVTSPVAGSFSSETDTGRRSPAVPRSSRTARRARPAAALVAALAAAAALATGGAAAAPSPPRLPPPSRRTRRTSCSSATPTRPATAPAPTRSAAATAPWTTTGGRSRPRSTRPTPTRPAAAGSSPTSSSRACSVTRPRRRGPTRSTRRATPTRRPSGCAARRPSGSAGCRRSPTSPTRTRSSRASA